MGEIIKSTIPKIDAKYKSRRIYEKEINNIRYRIVIDVNKKNGILISFYTNR